jgi:SAM-dependent methyltransferase
MGNGEPLGTAWGADEVVEVFDTDGFSDRGEQAALDAVAGWRRGRVLDIAVGGGRTTGLLSRHAASYVGIDIAEGMVELARERFPGADLRIGDARDLAGFEPGSFDLVVFSFNGIDSLDHDDRRRAVRAMRRVVAPTGRVVFSTFSLDGVSFDERPWTMHGFRTGRALAHLTHYARHPGSWLRSCRNYLRSRRESQDGPAWARRPMRALDFQFVVHFATLGSTVELLRSEGLEPMAAFSDTGDPVDLAAQHSDADYVHLVCRPAPSPSAGP